MGSQCVAVRCVCCSVLSEIYIGLVTYEDDSHVNRVESLALIFVPDTGGEPVCYSAECVLQCVVGLLYHHN